MSLYQTMEETCLQLIKKAVTELPSDIKDALKKLTEERKRKLASSSSKPSSTTSGWQSDQKFPSAKTQAS